jgi:hypothetical protein
MEGDMRTKKDTRKMSQIQFGGRLRTVENLADSFNRSDRVKGKQTLQQAILIALREEIAYVEKVGEFLERPC